MEIKVEKWLEHEIRFIEKTPGEWWALAYDVAKALGYAKPENAISRHCKNQTTTPKQGGGTNTVIPTNDIYRLIFRSKLPEAENFENWVYSVIEELRKASNLEGFQIFRMLDKEHQKEAMTKLKESLAEPVKVDYIKCNTIANKAVSNMFGYDKMVKKDDMTPEMLVERQKVLNDTVELMGTALKFGLSISVKDAIYSKYN